MQKPPDLLNVFIIFCLYIVIEKSDCQKFEIALKKNWKLDCLNKYFLYLKSVKSTNTVEKSSLLLFNVCDFKTTPMYLPESLYEPSSTLMAHILNITLIGQEYVDLKITRVKH